MDRYRQILHNDVRLFNRDLRHNIISHEEIETRRAALSDISEQTRWLNQDGSLCSDEKTEELFTIHQEKPTLSKLKVND